MAMGVKHIAGITEHDVVYTPLPLYHTAGGILGVSSVLLGGSTCVIRSKFSASNYWTDCVKYECTVSINIHDPMNYSYTTYAHYFENNELFLKLFFFTYFDVIANAKKKLIFYVHLLSFYCF